MNEPTKSPPERSPVSYFGTCVAGLGFLLFISTFFSFAANFGKFEGFDAFAERGQSMALRAVSGMTLMIVGGVISSIVAGRKIRPQINRIFDEAANAVAKRTIEAPPKQPVHCQYCNTNNDPTRSTCQNCGAALV